ncbi:MAG: hypothetical protein ABS939_17950 [Psychrobacillus sp.]
MEKMKRFITKHWINVALIVFVGTVSWYSIQYAKEYSASAKTTNDIRSIWQLAITAIAGSVGIGTIINSTRSASSAAESIRATKDRDTREQSSHIIAVSPIGQFPIDLPHYKRSVSQQLDTKRTVKFDHFFIGQAIAEAQNSRLSPVMSDIGFTVFNSGKGSCLNLEYDFTIANTFNFRGYTFNFDENDVLEEFPSYSFEFLLNKKGYGEIKILNEWVRKGLLKIGQSEVDALEEAYSSFELKPKPTKRYHEMINSGAEVKFNLPSNFTILCRQYLVVKHLQKLINDIYSGKSVPVELEKVLKHTPIKPIGEICFSYHDESEIRTGNYDFNQKSVRRYSITLKELEDYDVTDELPYFLQISPLKHSIIQERRAYH